MSNLSTINLGTYANDSTGDDARTAGGKLNAAIAYLNHQLVVWSAGELFPFGADNLLRVWQGKVYELVAVLPYTTQVGVSPDFSEDWILVFPIALNSKQDKIPSIPIKTRQYKLYKHLNNNDPTKLSTRQNNDIVYNVQWSATEVWQMAMCIDETKSADDRTAWKIHGKKGTSPDDPNYDADYELQLI